MSPPVPIPPAGQAVSPAAPAPESRPAPTHPAVVPDDDPAAGEEDPGAALDALPDYHAGGDHPRPPPGDAP
ncbi:MAG: hypothetical protein HY856_16245 [Burkholderiales bacterium]|nr:hypothetical protein [Burkholderiales bacterium]